MSSCPEVEAGAVLKLALIGFVFSSMKARCFSLSLFTARCYIYSVFWELALFYKTQSKSSSSATGFWDWLCFGFVFPRSDSGYPYYNHVVTSGLRPFGLPEIGFVLHNRETDWLFTIHSTLLRTGLLLTIGYSPSDIQHTRLALIGFVFSPPKSGSIYIILSLQKVCVHSASRKLALFCTNVLWHLSFRTCRLCRN